MKFVVSGNFKMGWIRDMPFEKEVEAESEEKAKEKVYALLGSQHKCPRHLIKIKEIKVAENE